VGGVGSKKYKGKPCVYCADAPSETPDHVFARQFFLPSQRTGLPKVPACKACNGHKSTLEHYAATVLPFGGRHSGALSNLQTMVPKRLDRNAPLRDRIREGMRPVVVHQPDGLAIPAGLVPLDYGPIEELFGLIGRGLLWHHFGALLGEGDVVTVHALNGWHEQFFQDHFFSLVGEHVLTQDLGQGTVVYQGFQTSDCPQGSVWRIRFYGGIQLASSGGGGDSIASGIGVITGPAAWEADAAGT
jgi:hypothetical protein